MAERVSYVIVGNGIAGITAAEVLRMEDAAATIGVIADDPYPVYYRPALKDYLAGRINENKLWARSTNFYQEYNVRFLPDHVVQILPQPRALQLQSGRQVEYEHLLVASGARPLTLTCPGNNLRGVATLRTVTDYQRTMEYLNSVQRVVVVGSGTLAMETIETLRQRGYEVTHLIRRQTLWSEVLDPTASDLILQQERRNGVDVRLGEEVVEITGKDGQVTGVLTTSGARIACEMVIVAIGVAPEIGFVRPAGVECGRGIHVDNAMCTSVPGIYAAGDVLETVNELTGRSRIIGQWYPAIQQARAAAYSMLNLLDTDYPFRSSTFYNATFLYGLDFASVGVTNITNAPGLQELVAEPQPRTYRKVVLKDGIPVGMLALGNRRQVLEMKRAIDHRVNIMPVANRLFNDDFNLSDWLDSEGVPPALLSAQRVGNEAVKRQAYASGKKLALPRGTPLSSNVPVEAFLVHQPDPVTALNFPEMRLSKTKVIAIGRQPGMHILIDQGSVSRRHAEISYANGRYLLRDLGSSNGTFINDVNITPQSVHVLKPGDIVRFGKFVTFKFVVRAQKRGDNASLPGGATRLFGFEEQLTRSPQGQPVMGPDGSLRLPGTSYAIQADVLASCKDNPALVVLTGKEGQRVPRVLMLKRGRSFTIGRDQDNDVALADAEVSRRHAEVSSGPEGFYIRDLESSNGVIINQERITNPYLLSHGDRILIGGNTFYFLDMRAGWLPTQQVQSMQPVSAGAARQGEGLATALLDQPAANDSSGAQVNLVVCSKCGVVNTPVARFCAGCSAPLKKAATT
jgi:NADPH-dependent 2,4-dienoyl-CoA reductase/sulfur reductase-like enzyme/pSer/pThr/pTyr-binding forkhead associated (FHA) protein